MVFMRILIIEAYGISKALNISSSQQMEPHVDLNTQIRLMKKPSPKYPQEQDVFQIKAVPPIPTDQLKDGQVIVKNLYISIDAAMRVWMSGLKTYMKPVLPGDVMTAAAVGEVIFSKGDKIKKGDKVLGLLGWQKYAVIDQKDCTLLPPQYPQYEDFLGVLGISGLTAYFGLHKIGKIKEGETVVVNAAAGAVGEIALQLAKIQGCMVCGIAGGDDKCEYLRTIGADFTINYKKDKVGEKMKSIFPKGIDVIFDNVGGEMLDDLLMFIRDYSRVVMCGSISSYHTLGSKTVEPYRLKNYPRLTIKRATMQGFIYFDYKDDVKAAMGDLMGYIAQGKLKFRVDMQNGLDQCPRALKKLLTGKNHGKVIVRVAQQQPKL